MSKYEKRSYVALVVVIVALAATVLYGGVVAPRLRYRHVESLLRSFKAQPSQATAEPLAELLQAGHPTQEQGTRIVQALLEPRVQVCGWVGVRGSQKLRIRVTYRHPVALPIVPGHRNTILFTHQLDPRKEEQGSFTVMYPWASRLRVTYQMRLIDRGAPGSASYPGVLKLDCRVNDYHMRRFAPTTRRIRWPTRPGWHHSPARWLRWLNRVLLRLKRELFRKKPRPTYYCTFTVPLELPGMPTITSLPRPD